MPLRSRLKSIKIKGYRPFRDYLCNLGSLEMLVGANGSGKSSLFEFLRFLRDSLCQDIPPEIIPGSIGQQIFHLPGPPKFWWSIEIDTGHPIWYQGCIMMLGPSLSAWQDIFLGSAKSGSGFPSPASGNATIRSG